MIAIIVIIGVFCCIPLFAFIVFGIKGAVEVREAKQKQREQQEEARKQDEEKKAAREAEERKCAALAEKYGVPAVRPAAALLLEKPADERRAELASFVGLVRQLPPDLLAEAESWEAAPAVESKKEGSAIFSSSLLRNGDELVLIQKSLPAAKFYFSRLKEAREAVSAFEEALASKEEGAVDAAIIAHWTGFGFLRMTENVRLFSMDDVAYFSISEQTTTTQTQTSSVDHTKMPGKLGTMTNEALFGSAYATAKAVQKANSATRTETTVRTDTKRTATLYFAPACGRQPLQFSGDDVNALEAMMPEKRK